MSINISASGIPGITAETDPTALKLTGGTLSGKINTTVTATTAPINIGSQPTAPTTTVAGDLWIGASINYKAWDGVQKAAANTNTTNQFTQGQAISVNSASNAFRINQQGTGPALVVEDSVSPDATPFVIDANGKVGIGVAPDVTAALKVDANGIMFSNGSIQTVASAVGPIGPAGANATAWVYKGAYDYGYTYNVGDFVDLDGSSYVMYNYIGAAGYPPPSYTGSWQLVASIGGTGATGSNGSDGSNGNDGGSYPDAPNDGISYVRLNEGWSQTFRDLQGNTSGDPYYPNEVKITVNGNNYWMPVRPV